MPVARVYFRPNCCVKDRTGSSAVKTWSGNNGEACGARNGNCRRLCRRSDCGLSAVMSLVKTFESSSLLWDAFVWTFWLVGAGGDARTLPSLYSYCGGLRFIISMAEGRSFGGAAEGAKGAAKVLHFQPRCCISVLVVPDQREKGQKRAKIAAKKMHQWRCNTFGQKSGTMEAPRERVFELILAATSAGKFGWSQLVVCRRCTGFVDVLYRFTELNRNGIP